MDIDQALAFTDALVFAKSRIHLSDLQQAMLRDSGLWNAKVTIALPIFMAILQLT